MNINLASIVAFSAGVVLIYAAVKNQDPRDVIRRALGNHSGQTRPISVTTGGTGTQVVSAPVPTPPVTTTPGVPVVSV